MTIDSYWQTRTVGETQEQGYTHLRAVCSDCDRIVDLPWPLGRQGPTRDTFLGNIPLRCARCGNTSPTTGV